MLCGCVVTLVVSHFVAQNGHTSHNLVLDLNEVKDRSLHTSQVARQAEAYPGLRIA